MIDLLNYDGKKVLEDSNKGFSDPNLWAPNPKDGQKNTYVSLLRFLYWWKDPAKSAYKKHMVYLTHPISKEFMKFDCPSSSPDRKSSIFWDLDTILRNRKKAEKDLSAVEDIKKYFNRFYNHFSPVYVVKDPHKPENNNKIKIFPYGYTIFQILDKFENPPEAEVQMHGTKGYSPFNPVESKEFTYCVALKNKFGKDYTSCKFSEKTEVGPFKYVQDGKTYAVKLTGDEKKDKAMNAHFNKFLQDNTPDMEQYFYKEMSDQQYEKAAAFLKAIISHKGIMSELIDTTRDTRMKELLADGKAYSKPKQQDYSAASMNESKESKDAAEEALANAESKTDTTPAAEPTVEPTVEPTTEPTEPVTEPTTEPAAETKDAEDQDQDQDTNEAPPTDSTFEDLLNNM